MLFLLLFELSILFGFLLDLLLADPAKLPHPVVIIGRGITLLEGHLRRIFPDTPRGKRAAGRVLAALIPLTTFVFTEGLCLLAWVIHPACFFLVHTLWCWQAVAIRGLAQEAGKVWRALTGAGRAGRTEASEAVARSEAPQEEGITPGAPAEARRAGQAEGCDDPAGQERLDAARRAVSRIVGRDTQALDEAGVIRAAVETVAENFSDGVMAPYFYMMLGGAPLALTYKAINTMDSMVGYKNERYLDFGRGAAHLDDAAGYIPARLGALLWILAAGMYSQGRGTVDARGNAPAAAKMNANGAGRIEKAGHGAADREPAASRTAGMRGAWRIWRRDRRNHASPNSAQTESACAGALGVQLAGPAYYFGQFYDKPVIGDPLRPIEAADILRASRMLYGASVLAVLLCITGSTLLLLAGM